MLQTGEGGQAIPVAWIAPSFSPSFPSSFVSASLASVGVPQTMWQPFAIGLFQFEKNRKYRYTKQLDKPKQQRTRQQTKKKSVI